MQCSIGQRNYESTSDKSIDKKFNISAKCNSLSSSIFYLDDPIYNNMLVFKFIKYLYLT